MNKQMSFTAALIALGVISAASAAPIRIQVTGSTAFRSTVFTAMTTAGGVFPAAAAVRPATASSGSGQIVYDGFDAANQEWIVACSWTGSEAGIANVAGHTTLQNPALPPGNNLPGDPTIFPLNDGTPGSTASQADLSFADTSQAVSLTTSPTLTDYGCPGVVNFVWAKGANSGPDTSWSHLVNVANGQILTALGSTVNANFLTGNPADQDQVFVVGRNPGSGTRVNCMLVAGLNPTVNQVSQVGINSFYNGAVLSWNNVAVVSPFGASQQAAAQAGTYPSILSCLNQQGTIGTNVIAVADDGYESGGLVSQGLSCDGNGSGVVIIGYAGISDATHAKNGVAYVAGSATPAQPSGAVWLTLDGVPYSDANVVNGAYSFWGHEHIYGQSGVGGNAATMAGYLKTGILAKGGLGDGTAGPSAGIKTSAMLADKPSGGDKGFPAPLGGLPFPCH